MPRTKILLSALIISILNLASVVIGFTLYKLSGDAPQLLVQIPAALVSGILLVMVWVVGFRRVNGLKAPEDYMAVLLLAFPIGAAVFTGVHFVVTGYLTSFGNIGPIWGLQFAENMLALPLAVAFKRRFLNRDDEANSDVQ